MGIFNLIIPRSLLRGSRCHCERSEAIFILRLLRRGVYPEVSRRASRNDENAICLCNDTPRLAAGFFIKSRLKVLSSVLSILFVAISIEAISYASTSHQNDTIVTDKELIILGKWNEKQLDHIIR